MNDSGELHVVFGTGPLGRAVIRRLSEGGRRVRAVSRRGAAEVPDGVALMRGNATDRDSVTRACAGASVVYHCASVPYTQWVSAFAPLMHGIIVGAAAVDARIVYGDNLYAYGPVNGPLTEDLPYDATGPKGRTRAEVAQTLMDAHATGKVRATIGRASDFFGPGVTDSHMGERVFRPVLAGRPAGMLGDPDTRHTFTYIEDFARGLVTLGERPEALGQVWHIPSAETVTTRQFLHLVFDEAGCEPGVRTMPRFILAVLARFNPLLREVRETLYQFDRPFVMDHGKFARAFGAAPTPHREAIRRTLEWYRANPSPGTA